MCVLCTYVEGCPCVCTMHIRRGVFMGVYYAHTQRGVHGCVLCTYVEGCPCVCIMHILRGVSMRVYYAHT